MSICTCYVDGVSPDCVLHGIRRAKTAPRPGDAGAVTVSGPLLRIEVDSCGACPFRELGGDSGGFCNHPVAAEQRAVRVAPHDLPDWCPLRNAATLIAKAAT